MLLFVCSKATDTKPVKLDTSHTVVLPPMVSVLSAKICPLDVNETWEMRELHICSLLNLRDY